MVSNSRLGFWPARLTNFSASFLRLSLRFVLGREGRGHISHELG